MKNTSVSEIIRSSNVNFSDDTVDYLTECIEDRINTGEYNLVDSIEEFLALNFYSSANARKTAQRIMSSQ